MSEPHEPAGNGPPPAEPQPTVASCASCRAPLTGRFCAACGEKRFEPEHDHSLRWLLSELLEGFVHLDAKLFRTAGALLLAPGRLSRAFLEGRRIRYLQPLSLFAITSIVFYLVFPNAYAANAYSMQQNLAQGSRIGNLFGFDFDAHFAAVAARTNEPIAVVQARLFERAGQESKVYLGVLVPWLAVVLHALLHRAQPRFVPTLVLALHLFVAFLCFDLVFLSGWKLTGANQLADEQFAPLFLAFGVHSALAMRHALRLRVWQATAAALAIVGALVVGIVVYRQVVTVVVARSL